MHLQVIDNVKKKLDDIKQGLPDDVKITTAYDRSGLIERAIDTLKGKLIEEIIIVAIVCIIFLLHARSAFVAIFTLPTAILMSFIVMKWQGINANIMSLGGIAIAIGAMVDAAIIMIENAHKHIEHENEKPPEQRRDHWQIITDASKEVGPALFYSLLVITVSFIPVFTLEDQEGTIVPSAGIYENVFDGSGGNPFNHHSSDSYGILDPRKNYSRRTKPDQSISYSNLFSRCRFCHYASINGSSHAAIFLICVTIIPFNRIGSEFMPPLVRRRYLYMPTTMPGISITKAKELLQQTDKILRQFPEVQNVFGKIGRAETATDPAGLDMIETIITLKPRIRMASGNEYPEADR